MESNEFLRQQYLPVFRTNYLVHGLPPEIVDQIADLATYDRKLVNEALVHKGEKSSDLLVILEGKVIVMTPKGEKLAEIGPPSVLGEVALVDDQPRSADAIALNTVTFAKLPANDLRKFMGNNREYGFLMLANLARVLSMRLRNTSAAVEMLSDRVDPWKFAT